MKQLSSADFRKHYAHESVACEVTAYGKVIGTWYPAGIELPVFPDSPPIVTGVATRNAPAPRMSIRPVKGPIRQMTGVPQRVIDPKGLRALEQERSEQLATRMYGGRRKS